MDHDHRRSRSRHSLYSGEDRLSSLPDAILIDVLSRIPIKLAAATSVLSHRWRSLWTGVTCLHLTPTRGSRSAFTSLIARIFCQLTSSIYGHNLVKIIIDENSGSPGDFRVPAFLFNVTSLVTLELNNGRLELEDLQDAVIRLPNLKRLKLSSLVHIPTCLQSGTLLKSCPLLEDFVLVFDLFKLPFTTTVVNVCAPNLKSLKINMQVCKLKSGAPRIMISIDAPKLVNLAINDCCTSYFSFVVNPTALVNVCIDLKSYIDYDGEGKVNDNCLIHWMSKFVCQMSCITRLKLNVDTDTNILPCFGDHRFMPQATFCNLVYLEVSSYNLLLFDDCMKHLLSLLQRFPNLQHLKVSMTGKPRLVQKVWNAPNFVPDCLASKLKTVELETFDGTRNDYKLLEYILSNAIALEKLRVHVCVKEDVNCFYVEREKAFAAWRECYYSKSVLKLPRISSICEVVVSGKYITATSDDAFKNGRLTCQVYLGP